MREPTWPFDKHEILQFDSEQDIHVMRRVGMALIDKHLMLIHHVFHILEEVG